MADKYDILLDCTEFEWDQGNFEKNWQKHGVKPIECEQVFFNEPLVVTDDENHSGQEKRYYALGKTDEKRLLFVVFTIRGRKLRVISARNMNRNERKEYRAS
ncbi:MAG: BrnT family toxin [candidate division FCPU426 bacterium]